MERTRYSAVAAAAVAAALAVFVATAAAAGTLDQSQTTADDAQTVPGAPAFPAYRVAQTFTAGITGSLTQVDLLLTRQFDPGNLVVEIRAVSAGVPSPAPLATAIVPQSAVPPGGGQTWVSVPFAVPAPSTAGTQYAVVVHAPQSDCGGDCWVWWASVEEAYAGGEALVAVDGVNWQRSAVADFAFRTYVTPGAARPTSKDECKDGGWRSYPDFRNQGDCMRSVTAGRG